jgi:site-specific DNA-methyltransferase (adenine-specific)
MDENTKRVMFSTGNDELETPQSFFDELYDKFRFVCDVAAVKANRKVLTYFGPDHEIESRRDCLTIDWPRANVWMNPPYSEPEHPCKKTCKKKRCQPDKRGHCITEYRPGCIDFVRKAVQEAVKGTTVVCLLAARTDNEWWHTYVWNGEARAYYPWVRQVCFVQGRLKFGGLDNSAPFPSVIVVFGPYA